MELNIKLKGIQEDTTKAIRVKDASEKKKQAKYEPTWEEVWVTGYGKKKGIFQTKVSDTDRQRLKDVKNAIENGELGTFVESLSKFSKSHALELYKVLQRHRRDSILHKMVEETPENYKLIQTSEQLEQLVKDLEKEEVVALDTETTGLDVYRDTLVGISFSLPKADYHVYIPIGHTEGQQLPMPFVLKTLLPLLTSPALGKVFHNAKFDIQMFIRHGVFVRGVKHDTRVAMAVLNENEISYALKNLATKYGKHFGFSDSSHTFEELFGKSCCFADVPLDVALVYAAKDTHLTYKLYQWQMEHLTKRPKLLKLYQEIENPLIEVVVEMEQAGFTFDLDFSKEYGEELRAEITVIENQLKGHFGDINFNSPAQLAKVLFDDLGLPDRNKRSTDVKTLKALKDENEGVALLLKYREYTKLLGTYVEALPEQLKPDGKIHGSFNQVSTVTGRFSSSEPNLQNLPPRARKLVVASDGKLIVGIDFSQIEPRVLAHISGDLHLREPYILGQDLYSYLASRVFKVPIEECQDGSKYRKMMKVGLLAVMYGTSMFTLANQLGITVEEAQQFIDDFFATYPEVEAWIKSIHEFVKKHEYVETMFNRKRRFTGHREKAIEYDRLASKICKLLGIKKVPFDFWDKEKYPQLDYKLKRAFQDVKGSVESVRRQSVNAIIQGTSADIMKKALLNLSAYCRTKGWQLIGTVHDEALMLVDANVTLQEIAELEACMTSTITLEVPLKVDTELMTRWGEGKKKGEWFQLAA